MKGERRVIDWNERTLRSLLFTPGNHPRRLEKVGTFGSDAIVLDLEDAVADAEKDAARTMVRDAVPTYDESTIVMVRVNSHETGRMEEDTIAVVCQDVDCLMVPKVEQPDSLPRMGRSPLRPGARARTRRRHHTTSSDHRDGTWPGSRG